MIKNGNDINAALQALSEHGGAVRLSAGEYTVESPIIMNTPSTKIQGDVWAYNLDPNGVFETPYGTKLRLKGRSLPAISVGVDSLPAGAMVCDIGIQGDIVGMDTRGLFDINNPSASAGLYFGAKRVDQGEFEKISCCGLGAAICIADNAEIDACNFTKINTDGCCLGVYMAPKASYYAHFTQCVMADNPSYGFFADGTSTPERKRIIHNFDVTNIHFVRNCGANHIVGEEPAAVYFKNISRCSFRDNIIDSPGVFWYYEPTAMQNPERQISKTQAIGLHVIGDQNRIFNNVFLHSSRESILIEGNGNVLMCNIADGDVIIEGENNTVNALAFSTDTARLILKGSAASSTVVVGVEERRIVRV